MPSSARLVPDCVLRVMHFNKFTLLTVRALKYKYKNISMKVFINQLNPSFLEDHRFTSIKINQRDLILLNVGLSELNPSGSLA